jgi:ABC-2 type transport system permease protein
MREFRLLLHSHIKTVVTSITTMGAFRLIIFVFVIACFLLGSYYLFFRIFSYLLSVEIIGPALTDRLIEMSFFVFFTMLLFSNVITSFSTFYNDRELDFLFSLPVRPTSIYLVKLIENYLYASWATMILAIPLVIAYGVTSHASFIYFPFSLLSVIVFPLIPAAFASTFIFSLLRLFPRLQARDIILLSLGLIITLTFLYMKITNPGLLKMLETENERELLMFAANLTTIGGTYVPSTWLSNILRGLRAAQASGFFYCGLLSTVSVATTILAYLCAKLLYVQSWLLIGEHVARRRFKRSLLSSHLTNPMRTFLMKDILTFVREPTQWVQLSMFVILLIVYIFSLRRTPMYFTFPLWRTIVSFANFAYISFVIATFGVRFIYPAISLERAGIWLIGSSPLSFKKIITMKYLSNLFLAVIIIEALLIFSNIFVRTDGSVFFIMPIIALFVAASLVSINLGFGSRFPHFNEDNPSKIAAGSGGIIAALASITYVGISLIILAAPAYHYLASEYFSKPLNTGVIYAALVAFVVLNILTIGIPLKIATRALMRSDF